MAQSNQHLFSQVPAAEIPRSSFNRSAGYKTTFDAGFLIPVFLDECIPGDSFNLKMTAFARLATPIHPYMDNVYLDSHFFAVPMRLIWDNWEKFNGAQTNPGDSTDFILPQMQPGTALVAGSMSDYFGIPTQVADIKYTSIFHRAYNLIYNEWFRDENLQNSLVVDTDDGPDDPTDYTIVRRGKRHDYFTSCLPFPQKGPSVELPLGVSAPVIGLAVADSLPYVTNLSGNVQTDGITAAVTNNWENLPGSANLRMQESNSVTGTPGIYADLSTATAATINELREAFQVQRLYERDARGGTRYTEIIKSHFNVTSPDSRLQRPEYLGGGSTPINVNPVAQTSQTEAVPGTPQANLSAFATVTLNNHGFTKSFTEHCVIIGFVSARADLTYQQGLNRMFSRQGRFDFYWPVFSHLGEQAVLNQEIYAQGSAGGDADLAVFGYQERYAEYRYKPSLITGQFRSNFSTPLDTWHLAQDFATLPTLNSTFIEENPPIDRIIAVPSEPHFIFDSFIQLQCARPMPMYSVPGFIDHF